LPDRSSEAAYRDRFAEIFNFATLPFYWGSVSYTLRDAYEPEDGVLPARDKVQACARWCLDNGIVTKGHPLMFMLREAEWLHDVDDDTAESCVWHRITREVEDFRDAISVWDVVNEASRGLKEAEKLDARGTCVCLRRHGDVGMLKKAFSLAREANPDATLILNDMSVRKDGPFEVLLRKAIDAGLDFDVVGLQSHMLTFIWEEEYTQEICDRFASYGMPLHFTESSVLSGSVKTLEGFDWRTPLTGDARLSTPEGEAWQAEKIESHYRLLFSHPAVQAITYWDLWDGGSFMFSPHGFLRADLSPKPSYDVLRRLIKEEWWTREDTAVDNDGAIGFRGFLGEYRLSARVNGADLQGTLSLTSDAEPTAQCEFGPM
jgi:GH35 family endo-1,4-beta-xylanase